MRFSYVRVYICTQLMLEILRDAGYELGVTTDTDMDFLIVIFVFEVLSSFWVAKLRIYLKYPVVHFVSSFVSTDTPVAVLFFNRNELRFVWWGRLNNSPTVDDSLILSSSKLSSSKVLFCQVEALGSRQSGAIGSRYLSASEVSS
jgi:hypothetical protein